MLYVWSAFAVAALIILWAGSRLIKYGDIIAERTGLNRTWIGMALLGIITALPEISNGISAVTTIRMPDLAIAPLFGACLFNMLIIGILDIIYNFYGKGPMLKDVEEEAGHIITAGLAIMLLAIGGMGVLVGKLLPPISFYGIGVYSIFIIIIFFFAQRIIFHFERRDEVKFLDKKVKKLEFHEYEKTSLLKAYLRFVFFALLVVAAGAWLPILAAEIADVYGLSTTIVGALLVGAATTLPELVVSVSAVAIGALDVAVGTLFASGVFNMAIIFIVDCFNKISPILPLVSIENSVTALFAIIATAVAAIGMVYRTEKHIFRRIGWDAVGIISTVCIAVYVLWKLATF
jgi:cation:H+ antiporter